MTGFFVLISELSIIFLLSLGILSSKEIILLSILKLVLVLFEEHCEFIYYINERLFDSLKSQFFHFTVYCRAFIQ